MSFPIVLGFGKLLDWELTSKSNCCLTSILVIIGDKCEPTVDHTKLVNREVPQELEIGLHVKRNVMHKPTVTGRSESICVYNPSQLWLVYYDRAIVRPLVLRKDIYNRDVLYNEYNILIKYAAI